MIDFTFIAKLEGSSRKGYVPDPENSQSGVTVACGFDIGQRGLSEICHAFPTELAGKLTPYVGKTKQEALSCLNQHPLEITPLEEAKINQFSHAQAENRLKQQWQNSRATVPFDALSNACQTVIASVAFQYGNLAQRTPNFWQQVTSQDWQAALANLRDFGDKYATRRNIEADLLEANI